MSDTPFSESTVSVRFHVLADTCPGLLPRLLIPLAKRDLVADVFHARREGDLTRVEMALHAMPAGMVHLVAGNLGQVVGVREVRVAQHGRRDAAPRRLTRAPPPAERAALIHPGHAAPAAMQFSAARRIPGRWTTPGVEHSFATRVAARRPGPLHRCVYQVADRLRAPSAHRALAGSKLRHACPGDRPFPGPSRAGRVAGPRRRRHAALARVLRPSVAGRARIPGTAVPVRPALDV